MKINYGDIVLTENPYNAYLIIEDNGDIGLVCMSCGDMIATYKKEDFLRGMKEDLCAKKVISKNEIIALLNENYGCGMKEPIKIHNHINDELDILK